MEKGGAFAGTESTFRQTRSDASAVDVLGFECVFFVGRMGAWFTLSERDPEHRI